MLRSLTHVFLLLFCGFALRVLCVCVCVKYGLTTLHYACANGHAAVAELLVDAGADTDASDHVLSLLLSFIHDPLVQARETFRVWEGCLHFIQYPPFSSSFHLSLFRN